MARKMSDHPTRAGPIPLALHLAAAQAGAAGAAATLPMALMGAVPWHDRVKADADELVPELQNAGLLPLQMALQTRALSNLAEMIQGIDAYRAHPYCRADTGPLESAEFGSTRVLEYGDEGGKPILCIPSLVNPSYVLDLKPGRSLMAALATDGFRPMLVDWGAPGESEAGFSMDEYVARLSDVLEHVVGVAGGPVPVLGYCMGGNLAMALATLRGEAVERLALLATPWDFSHHVAPLAVPMAASLQGLEANGPATVPMEVVQVFFASLDPTLAERKFRAFSNLDQSCERAEEFVALEDWANDGAPLTARVLRHCVEEWYIENRPAKGTWKVADTVVSGATIQCPAFAAIPKADRIVPPESALALANEIAGCTICRPPSGHVGMIVSSRAEAGLWAPLREWLKS